MKVERTAQAESFALRFHRVRYRMLQAGEFDRFLLIYSSAQRAHGTRVDCMIGEIVQECDKVLSKPRA